MRIFATQQGNFAPNPQNPRPSPPRTTPPKAVASDAQRKLVWEMYMVDVVDGYGRCD